VRNNQSGISIIEVIMSFAVLGLVTVGFLTFTETHTKISKSIDAGFEVVDFVGQVRLALSQPRACLQTLALAGIPLPVSSATDRPITRIRGASAIPYSSPTTWNDYTYKTNNDPLSPKLQVLKIIERRFH
jgi:hypothetical protein